MKLFLRYAIPLFGLLLLLLTYGCENNKPIRIGFIGTLSGSQSEVAVAVRNAVEMHIAKINHSGGINGRKIELVVKDIQGSPEKCKVAFKELIDEDIKFVVGPIFSAMAKATLASIEGQDILVMSPTMSTDFLSGKDDNFIRISSTTRLQGEVIADNILSQRFKSMAAVYDLRNKSYTELIYNTIRDLVKKNGVTVRMPATIDSSNVSQLSRIADKTLEGNPECILFSLSAIDAATMAQLVRKKDKKVQFYGVSWSQTNDLLTNGGRSVEGMHLVSVFTNKVKSQRYKYFESNYRKKYYADPSFPGYRGYDAFSVLADGMEAAKDLTPTAVKSAILTKKKFDGLDAPIEIDGFGDVVGGYSMVKVINGEYVHVE